MMGAEKNDVIERLYKDASDRIERTMNAHDSITAQTNNEYSFHPQISKTSKYISEQSEMFSGNNKDFFDRQQKFIEQKLEKRELVK